MLFLGFRLGYFSDLEMKQYCSQLDEIGKMLFGLSKSLKIDYWPLVTDLWPLTTNYWSLTTDY
jgi:hypothetical protein